MEIKFTCDYLDNKPGSANLKFYVEIPQAILASFYWADEQGKELENYLAIKAIPIVDGIGEYTTNKNMIIPEQAKKIRCRVFKDTMKEIELPELLIDIPEEKQWKPRGTLLKTYVASSDIHVGGEYFNNTANRIAALSRIRDMKPDGVIIAGDITNNSKETEYRTAIKLIDEYCEGIPVYASPGNHDYHPYTEGCTANIEMMGEFFRYIADRNNKLGEKCSQPSQLNYFDGTIKGVQVLVTNPCREDHPGIYEKEHLEWLDKKLSETDGERYRFVVTHYPQNHSVSGPLAILDHLQHAADDLEFQEILNRHKNIIHLSGHTHYDFDSDGLNTKHDTDYDNLYINCGCLVWCGVRFSQRPEYYIKDRCTLQVIEVYEDCMIIRGLECVSGKFVPRCLHRAEF